MSVPIIYAGSRLGGSIASADIYTILTVALLAAGVMLVAGLVYQYISNFRDTGLAIVFGVAGFVIGYGAGVMVVVLNGINGTLYFAWG